ncbi:hypothetical protein PINS_up007701 [Pythium insidiosum]|nr:hypothetical protein PINS_up007701 [Pythium insidiosum]
MARKWLQLVGEDGNALTSTTSVVVDIEDVAALRDAVKEKYKDSRLARIDASDLIVFDANGVALPKSSSSVNALGNDEDNALIVRVPQRAPTVPRVNKKRKLTEMRELITPSSFAKCKGAGSWVKWLKKLDGQIECHRLDRSDDTTPIPLVLLNKTFARFEENCREIEFGNEDCEFVMKLCHGMSIPYESEAELAEKARNLLTEYLLVDYPASTITPATVNGSVSDGSYRFGDTLLLNLVCKLQKGDGGGDPTMENIAFYIKTLPDVIDRQFPCFLVDICGPLMSVFGMVNTGDEDAICEPLVMSFPLLFFDNEWLMVSLTRVCASLKTALQELTNECHQFATCISRRKIVNTTDLDRLGFPYKDSFELNGATASLQYVNVVQRFVFVAKLQDGNEVIVKFAKRYGKQVHQYCADAGFAPALLCCESLPSGWTFVVMERLPLISLARAKADQTMVRDQLRDIRSTLAAASFVHGDLRECNVMWDPVAIRVVLVDFDWAGKDGAATYPPFMNGEIAWPPGAESGKPLRPSHDAYWLDSICRRLRFS